MADERLKKLRGRIRFPEDKSDPRYFVLSPDGKEIWYEVQTAVATVDDVVKMSEMEPDEKPFVVEDTDLYKIRAGRLTSFVPKLDGDVRLRAQTRQKIRVAAMTNTSLEKAGIAETPETVAFYEKSRRAVEEMLAQGVHPELPIEATEAMP